MERKDIPVYWSVVDQGTKEETGWSLLDTWVQPLNRRVDAGGADAGSRHVWIQADDLDAQGTIVVPVRGPNELLIMIHDPNGQPGSKDIYKVRSNSPPGQQDLLLVP